MPPRRKRPSVSSCEQHAVRVSSYLAFFDDCANRQKRGERQVRCDECGLWVWPLEASFFARSDGPV
jgi:hypothetical protein